MQLLANKTGYRSVGGGVAGSLQARSRTRVGGQNTHPWVQYMLPKQRQPWIKYTPKTHQPTLQPTHPSLA